MLCKADKLIRIDRQVYEALRQRGDGFDSPNNVLRKLFGMEPNKRGRPQGAGRKKKLAVA